MLYSTSFDGCINRYDANLDEWHDVLNMYHCQARSYDITIKGNNGELVLYGLPMKTVQTMVPYQHLIVKVALDFTEEDQ